jgi:U32 family peptidase
MSPASPHRPELLSPAGNWECARAAVANGADAIYFGMPRFNARLRADNFTVEDLPELMTFLHHHGVKGYVAFNTLIFTAELGDAADQLRALEAAAVDAVIVQDLGLARMVKALTPNLRLHASTQMTLTSPEGVEFAKRLDIDQAVLGRELSLRELERFKEETVPLEVFVHGALCVAYSGQCLTSESLGKRSANRGECAQACRMTYELMVDGELRDLGDKRYLLSPQDLAAVHEIPRLIELGIRSFKIEGRLKTPEYVAAVTRIYRRAIDEAHQSYTSLRDLYELEMAFSRGLFSGWMHGVNHQKLVGALYGKKRGPIVGNVTRIVNADTVELDALGAGIKPGDGIAFENLQDTNREQGGAVYEVRGRTLSFRHGHLRMDEIPLGTRVFKTSDPALNRELRSTFEGEIPLRKRRRLALHVCGKVGEKLTLSCDAVSVQSEMALQTAMKRPLTAEVVREQLGRLGGTAFELADLQFEIEGAVMLPVSELNRLRRELVAKLEASAPALTIKTPTASLESMMRAIPKADPHLAATELRVLCRTTEQIEVALAAGVKRLYVDFEDIRNYAEAVKQVRSASNAEVWLATPRIQKATEAGFFKLIERAEPDGVLIRNLGALAFFKDSPLRLTGDFSLNVANPLTAAFLKEQTALEQLTISYDLNLEQVIDLLHESPPEWFELTLHQHMPMFHMEHCVFAAFMSNGTDFTNCGRPCERHRVHLRDRVGMTHPLKADVGCRNTLFNAVPQTGAVYFDDLTAADLRTFRVELLEHDAEAAQDVIQLYQQLISGEIQGDSVWRRLRAQSQLGVTRGTLDESGV